MTRFPGILKVSCIFLLDFSVLYRLTGLVPALLITGGIAFYTVLGGHAGLWVEGAVPLKKLPACERERLAAVKRQLEKEVLRTSGAHISSLKLYLLPKRDDLNASAYGHNCIAVTEGTFEASDDPMLCAVLCHEISHTLRMDPEVSRAVIASVTLMMAALSLASAASVAVLFLLFLVFRCFGCCLGYLAFRGLSRFTGGAFRLIQRGVVLLYQGVLGMACRHAEYQCDAFACRMGYGVPLSLFLSLIQEEPPSKGLGGLLYCSHPPLRLRIARLEEEMARSVSAVERI